MRGVKCKNDISANLGGLLNMSPVPYISTMGYRSITSKSFKIFKMILCRFIEQLNAEFHTQE